MRNVPQVRLVIVLAGDDWHPHHEIDAALGQRHGVSQDDRIAYTGQSVVPVGVEGLDVEHPDAFPVLTVRIFSVSITYDASKSTG